MDRGVKIQLPRGFALTLDASGRNYTVATLDPPLPFETAARLADARAPRLPMRHPDRLSERVGEVIRAHGHGGGLTGKELATYQGAYRSVETWHVDAPEAVGVLVAWLVNEFTQSTFDAAMALTVHRARATDSFLRELEKVRPTGYLRALIVNGEADARVNADDPRWVALKARLRAEIDAPEAT